MQQDNMYITIEDEIIQSRDMILTRYLYSKSEVVVSLCISLLDRNKDEALFWGYELYFSGFEEETLSILSQIYELYYKRVNPKLATYLWRMTMMWNDNRTLHYILGSIIVNMVFRQTSLLYLLVQREIDVYHSDVEINTIDDVMDDLMIDAIIPDEKRIYIMFTVVDIENYVNPVHLSGKARNILGEKCKYIPRRYAMEIIASIYISNIIDDNIVMQRIVPTPPLNPILESNILHNWTYFASFSPIWMHRLQEFEGHPNHESMTVEFSDDDMYEAFNCLYGYEPDEQSYDVMCIFLNRECKGSYQMKWLDFCNKYHTDAIVLAPVSIIRHSIR